MAGRIQRKRHVQLTLDQARKPSGRGGWRPGAGRKKKPGAISHDTRPEIPARFPQHVTLRQLEGAPKLARDWLMKIVRRAIRDSQQATFRIVEFNVLGNHVHLLTEASGKDELRSGVSGLEVRIAQRVNAAVKRSGRMFERYHARSLTTPTQVRNTIRYVLFNRKHHAPNTNFDRYFIDPFSSAPWAHWATDVPRWKRNAVDEPAPTVKAETWLLATGWMKLGLLRFDETPA